MKNNNLPNFNTSPLLSEIETVLNNLKKYADSVDDKKRIIIKYIFTENNFDTEELKNFIEKIVNFDLINSIFHISCDFRIEVIPERIMEKAPIQTSFFINKSPLDKLKFLIFLAFAKVLSKLKFSSGKGEVVTQSVL